MYFTRYSFEYTWTPRALAVIGNPPQVSRRAPPQQSRQPEAQEIGLVGERLNKPTQASVPWRLKTLEPSMRGPSGVS